MVVERFHDEGVRLESFVTTVDVVCPTCGRRALVRSATTDVPARVVCGNCAFVAEQPTSGWLGALSGIASRRCPSCGERIERRFTGPRHEHPVRLDCRCGWQVDTEIQWWPEQVEGTDPLFGLDLWLRSMFRSHVLWAYNADHLRFLREYVAADLRERVPTQNGSTASRLPKWIKSARNRDDLLAAIIKLETRDQER